jgi:hypothetical protein
VQIAKARQFRFWHIAEAVLVASKVRFSIAASVKPRLDYLMPLPFFASADDATRGSCFSSRSGQAAS